MITRELQIKLRISRIGTARDRVGGDRRRHTAQPAGTGPTRVKLIAPA